MRKRLSAFGVDGTTFAVDTNHNIFTVAIGKQVIIKTIHCFNDNATSANIGVWHVSRNDTLGMHNRILEDFPVAAHSPCDLQLDITASLEDRIYVRSSASNVNFVLWGEEE